MQCMVDKEACSRWGDRMIEQDREQEIKRLIEVWTWYGWMDGTRAWYHNTTSAMVILVSYPRQLVLVTSSVSNYLFDTVY